MPIQRFKARPTVQTKGAAGKRARSRSRGQILRLPRAVLHCLFRATVSRLRFWPSRWRLCAGETPEVGAGASLRVGGQRQWGAILDCKLDVGFANGDRVDLAAVRALNSQDFLPSSGKALGIGLNAGRGSSVGSRACEEQWRHVTLRDVCPPTLESFQSSLSQQPIGVALLPGNQCGRPARRRRGRSRRERSRRWVWFARDGSWAGEHAREH